MLKTSIGSGVNLGENGSLERFKTLKSLGYDAVDYQVFCTEPDKGIFTLSDTEFERFLLMDAKNAKEVGLEIIQTHGLWPYDDTKPEQYDIKFDGMIKSIKGSALLGAKYVVMHPVMPLGWNQSPHHTEDIDLNIQYFKKLIPYAKEYGIKIALENMPNLCVPCGCIKELTYTIDAINCEYLVACFDTGHYNTSGIEKDHIGTISEALSMLGDRLACLHIHDNDGRQDLHLPPYYGNLDWEDFIIGLKNIHYNGVINLEAKNINAPSKIKEQSLLTNYTIARHLAEKVSKL